MNMVEKVKSKQIRLNPEVRGLLDDYKMDDESYSIAIKRLFDENKRLEERLEYQSELNESLYEQIRLMKLKETSIKLDEDLLSLWSQFMEDNPDELNRLELSQFIRNQIEWTLYLNHYVGLGDSKEELKERRKKQRKLKIPR